VRLRHAPNPTVAGVNADRHSSDPLSSSRQSMLDTEAASPAIAQCVRSRAPDPVIPVPPALGYQPRIVLVPLTSAPLGPGCPRDSELQTPGGLCPPSCRCPVDRRMGRRWPTFPPHPPVSCVLPMRMCCSCLFPWRVIAPMFSWPVRTAAAAASRDFPRNVPGVVAPCVWENPGSSDLQLLAC